MVETTILIAVIVGSVVALVLLGLLTNLVYKELWKVYITPLWKDLVAFWNAHEVDEDTKKGDVVTAEAEGASGEGTEGSKRKKNPMLSGSRNKNPMETPKGVTV